MGTVLRKIACENNGQKGLETFNLRFQRILACSGREELADQLHGIFRAAKQRGIAVNHNSLFDDLWYWNDRVKLEWAQSFWGNANHD
jgi:CRISPR type I-E-associated protein CasB/Cse2